MDREQQDELATALAAAEPELTRLLTEEADAAAALTAAETDLHEGQAAWETFNRRHGEVLRQAEVERTRIEHLERQLPRNEQRLERLRLEREQLAEADLHVELDRTTLGRTGGRRRPETSSRATGADRNRPDRQPRSQQQADPALRELRERLLAGRGRLASLQTLQEAALGRHESESDTWLRARGL